MTEASGMFARGGGILLHPISLSTVFGIGDLGPAAYEFVDFLDDAGQKYWQVLPINPTDARADHSPYHSASAFAGNPLLISPELLQEEGRLHAIDLSGSRIAPSSIIDYAEAQGWKRRMFEKAYANCAGSEGDADFASFCEEQASWLDDYALFSVLKSHRKERSWIRWPQGLRDRNKRDLESRAWQLQEDINRVRFQQFLIFKQWQDLHRYARRKGISIIGDMPIYVTLDSADVWIHPDLFQLDKDKRPRYVAGVPPDYFSRTGQLWGNPLYDWAAVKRSRYAWWVERFQQAIALFDIVRVDHFRGFVAYWQIPSGERNAVRGRWIEAPAGDFFRSLLSVFPSLPLIAEDLGTITPDVIEIMQRFGFPGMKILQFGFGQDDPDHAYLPHNYPRRCVAYTGTHDNNTLRGWFETEATAEEKKRVLEYLQKNVPPETISEELIRTVMMSKADVAVIPMQDYLGLGSDARMNRPARAKGNWRWRLLPGQLSPSLSSRIAVLMKDSGRT